MDGGMGVSKEPQIRQQLTKCEIAIENLHKSIAELEGRIEVVITPPTEKPKDVKPIESLVSLANELRVFVDGVSSAIDKINNLRNRIEL